MRLAGLLLSLMLMPPLAWSAPVQNASVTGLPARPVDDSLARHAVERRGFVQVPFQYDSADTRKIHIFYRWIRSSAGPGAPTLIFMNGGPGMPSSMMRPLDYDYAANPTDKLTFLLGVFNVVLVDQRGTDGGSFPLDQSNLDVVSFRRIANHFNADVLALDHARVVEKLITRGLLDPARFYILGHSFGLQIAQSFIRLTAENKISRRPAGMIMSAGQLGDPLWTWIGARPSIEQFSRNILNYSVTNGLESFDRLMLRAKSHFASLGVSPNVVHYAYADTLSYDNAGDYDYVLELMGMRTRTEVESYMQDNTDVFGAINPVLSIQSLNGGRMADELLAEADLYYPLDGWVIDPLKAFAVDDAHLPRKKQRLESLVRSGAIAALARPTAAQFRAYASRTKLMFHFGRLDMIAGPEVGKQNVIDLFGQATADQITYITSGGHRDIRSSEGIQAIKAHFGL